MTDPAPDRSNRSPGRVEYSRNANALVRGQSWKAAAKEPRPDPSQRSVRPAFPCFLCGSANSCEHPR